MFLESEGIQSYKVVCEIYCSILDREVRGLKYLSGSQSFPSYLVATKLDYSIDTASRLNLRSKFKLK